MVAHASAVTQLHHGTTGLERGDACAHAAGIRREPADHAAEEPRANIAMPAAHQIIHDNAVAGDPAHLAQHLHGILRREVVERRDVTPRYDERMRGGLRVDIFQDDQVIVLIEDRAGDFASDDLAEQAVSVVSHVDISIMVPKPAEGKFELESS